jgi:hypothetical protein
MGTSCADGNTYDRNMDGGDVTMDTGKPIWGPTGSTTTILGSDCRIDLTLDYR